MNRMDSFQMPFDFITVAAVIIIVVLLGRLFFERVIKRGKK